MCVYHHRAAPWISCSKTSVKLSQHLIPYEPARRPWAMCVPLTGSSRSVARRRLCRDSLQAWIWVTVLFSNKEHVLQKPLKVKWQLRQNAEESKLILNEHHTTDWKQTSILHTGFFYFFFIGSLCSQMRQDSHKGDEKCSGSGSSDVWRQPSDKRDKSRADFHFPAFVSLFYSILRVVESNNSFLLWVWTHCTASVFVRNPIIKMGYEWKKNPKRASTVSADVFQLCDLSFLLLLFSVSLLLLV